MTADTCTTAFCRRFLVNHPEDVDMTNTLQIGLASIVAGTLLLAGCTPKDGPVANKPSPGKGSDVAATGNPDQIAIAGHGELFDADMHRIILTEKSLIAMQDGLLKRLGDSRDGVDPRLVKMIETPQLLASERFWLRGALISAMLAKREDKASQRLLLVNDYILQRSARFRVYRLSPELLERIRDLLGRLATPFGETDYTRRCREAKVPIPPTFATGGSKWINQGALTTNVLSPGEYAGVYTYHDPAVRGACVALPRGGGGPGSLMGIICQSAETGAACFWDNKLRSGGPSAPPIGWASMTIRISDLQDGDNLRENCTSCHTGNNVYVVMPDDPTWGKLLRRNMAGTDHGNFTLRARSATDASSPSGSGSSFRYTPISDQGWANGINQPGCASGCHEGANGNVTTRWQALSSPPPMPPACSRQPGLPTDGERCYVNPF
jgi:hypothetical protein